MLAQKLEETPQKIEELPQKIEKLQQKIEELPQMEKIDDFPNKLKDDLDEEEEEKVPNEGFMFSKSRDVAKSLDSPKFSNLLKEKPQNSVPIIMGTPFEDIVKPPIQLMKMPTIQIKNIKQIMENDSFEFTAQKLLNKPGGSWMGKNTKKNKEKQSMKPNDNLSEVGLKQDLSFSLSFQP